MCPLLFLNVVLSIISDLQCGGLQCFRAPDVEVVTLEVNGSEHTEG